MVDGWITWISKLSGHQIHHEELNHEMVCLKKSNTIYWRGSGLNDKSAKP
jgi:hypothetical protein